MYVCVCGGVEVVVVVNTFEVSAFGVVSCQHVVTALDVLGHHLPRLLAVVD